MELREWFATFLFVQVLGAGRERWRCGVCYGDGAIVYFGATANGAQELLLTHIWESLLAVLGGP